MEHAFEFLAAVVDVTTLRRGKRAAMAFAFLGFVLVSAFILALAYLLTR